MGLLSQVARSNASQLVSRTGADVLVKQALPAALQLVRHFAAEPAAAVADASEGQVTQASH